jgi:hypothetical protein
VRQTLKTWLLAWMLGAALVTHARNPVPAQPFITILVSNHSDASRQLILEAESDASQVFERAGLAVDWINCGQNADSSSESRCLRQVGPNDLVVRIVPRARTLPRWVFGVSFLSEGVGAYADVFLDHVKGIQEDHKETPLARVVGHVVAHEVGHLLLGTTVHSDTGIMQADWETDQLRKISMGRLLFSPEESRQICARVNARAPRAAAPVLAAFRP